MLIVIAENHGIDELACVDARVVSLTIRLCVISSSPGPVGQRLNPMAFCVASSLSQYPDGCSEAIERD